VGKRKIRENGRRQLRSREGIGEEGVGGNEKRQKRREEVRKDGKES